MVMQQVCRQRQVARGATPSGAAVVGGEASVRALVPHPGIKRPCGLRSDRRHKIGATGELVAQQNCAK